MGRGTDVGGNGSSFLLCFFPFLVFLDVLAAPEFTLATVVAKVLNLRLSHHQWNRVNRGPVVHLVHLVHLVQLGHGPGVVALLAGKRHLAGVCRQL